jgi:hypothetical protein
MTMLNDAARDPAERAMTIADFCYLENMSKATYYKLKRAGLGPRETHVPVPGMSFVRITAEARHDWHAMLAEMRETAAAKLATARKHAQTLQAGKLAAASPLHVANRQTRRRRGKAAR